MADQDDVNVLHTAWVTETRARLAQLEADKKIQSKNIGSFSVTLVSPGAKMPTKATSGSAGFDLYSQETIAMPPQAKYLFKLGFTIKLPPNTYGRIAPRSGLACRHFIDVGAGVVDNDYEGEVAVLLFNLGKDTYVVDAGDRIAQLIVEECRDYQIIQKSQYDSDPDSKPYVCTSKHADAPRATRGFGSTGK